MDGIYKSKDTIKSDNKEMSEKIIQLEEDIYKAKAIGLQLIEQLKSSEKEIRDVTEFSKAKIREIEDLRIEK